MTWDLIWTDPAKWALRSVHWTDAAEIDAAVIRYAETGEGDRWRLASDNAITIRLRVRSYRVRMTADVSTHTLWVVWLYRAEL